MLTRPHPSSDLPAYLQLAEQVKHAIATGALRPGERLPGIGAVAVELVISPKTVSRAYHHLEDDGIIDLGDEAGARLAFMRGSADPACRPLIGRRAHVVRGDRTFPGEIAGETSRPAAEIDAPAVRAKRDWELEAAREVQERLLPRDYPVVAGLDYAGFSRSAAGVGGDYFDFIRLSETGFAIAVGDVSGKGIPAALLMAMLRGYLRGQTFACLSNPARVMEALNRLVCDSFTANRYATFFYAHYDTSMRVLRYVNAGHNPPLVFRAGRAGAGIHRLDQGGPVIGFAPEYAYVCGQAALEPGDLIVAFTDGITEAMNTAGDEWGEERLTEVIGANPDLSARELVERITRRADEFSAGASQHDDMTVVAVRVTQSEQ
jgi:sigma-B regulation protein RsbU (phosphoserine phosphatase)